MAREPGAVAAGKVFHRELQGSFATESEGDVTPERECQLLSGRRGRIDIHVQVDDGMAAVVEFKRTNWNAMKPHRIRPNIRRHIRQLWRYVDAVLEEGMDVCPSLVYADPPDDPAVRALIEECCAEECITVVFADEAYGPGEG